MVTNKGIDLMEKIGGSFVRSLAECWCRADPNNKAILENSFHYFEEYEKQAERRGEK